MIELTDAQTKQIAVFALITTVLMLGVLGFKLNGCFSRAIVLDEISCPEFKTLMNEQLIITYRVEARPFDMCGALTPQAAATWYTVHCTMQVEPEWRYLNLEVNE